MSDQDLLQPLSFTNADKILLCEDLTDSLLKKFISSPEDFTPVTFTQIADHLLRCTRHQTRLMKVQP